MVRLALSAVAVLAALAPNVATAGTHCPRGRYSITDLRDGDTQLLTRPRASDTDLIVRCAHGDRSLEYRFIQPLPHRRRHRAGG